MIGKLINKIKFWNKKNDVFKEAERYLNDVPKNEPIEKYDAFNDLIRIDQYVSFLKYVGYEISEKRKCPKCQEFVEGPHYCQEKKVS